MKGLADCGGQLAVRDLLEQSAAALPEANAAQATRLLFACAKLGHRPDETFLQAWLERAQQLDFEPQELHLCISSSKKLNFTEGQAMMTSMRQAKTQTRVSTE
ncbi:unnamed protein product [Symbiodinium natans]|uniref:Uncharacterized protein n=1 Tax=Symbiodinium natans TaxID=878477 RepID=A0A812R746_9DINO|nr:unnamed protein product [Symbiodinium natans]